MAKLGTFTGNEINRVEIERPTNSIICEFSMETTVKDISHLEIVDRLRDASFSLTLENRGEESDIANRCRLLPVLELGAKLEGFYPITITDTGKDTGAPDNNTIYKLALYAIIKINPDQDNFDLQESEQFVLSIHDLGDDVNTSLSTYELNTYSREILKYNRQTIRKETLKEFDNENGRFLGCLFIDKNFVTIDKTNETDDGTPKTQRIDIDDLKFHNTLEEDETYQMYPHSSYADAGILMNGSSMHANYLWLDLTEIDTFSILADKSEDCQIINITEEKV